MTSLNGRVAIITGAGQGLGRAHARYFADQGAKVIVNDVPRPDGGSSAEDVVDEIHRVGGSAVAHVGSVSDWDSAAEMVELALRMFGELDVLVNNAGIVRDRMLVNMTEAEWEAVIDVHLKGHFVPLHHAARYWRDQAKNGDMPHASVINTTSTSGLRGNPGQLNYASAKAGIAAMTQVAARELERYGVRVNAVAPVARTQMTMSTPGIKDLMNADEGAYDPFAAENVSPVVAWLARASTGVSGQVLHVFGSRIGWQRGWSEQQTFEKEGAAWTPDELDAALATIPRGTVAFKSSVG